MATEPNNPNQNSGNAKKQAAELIKSFERIIDVSGDYNDLISDAVEGLKKLGREYDKIDRKVKSLSQTEINTKKLTEDASKAKVRSFIAERDLSKIISDAQNSGTRLQINRSAKLAELIKEKVRLEKEGNKDAVQGIEEQIRKSEQLLTPAEAQYAAALAQKEVAEQLSKEAQERLKIEKQVAGKIGLTGAAMKVFADKLGIGNKMYEALVLKARKLQDIQKDDKGIKKIGNFFTNIGPMVGTATKEFAKAGWDTLTDPFAMIPMIGSVIGGVVKGAKALLDFILEVEDRTVKFGRALGYSRQQSKEIAQGFAASKEAAGDLLVTSKSMMQSQTDLTNQLGLANIFSNEILATNVRLREVMGLGAEEASKIAESAIITGREQNSIVKGVIGQVAGLAKATGVIFDYKKILKEASTIGGYLGLQFAKYPEKLTKALVATKALGMDLKKVDQIAGSLLDFESTIQNQLEAQLITGKEINLSRAMQLSLENKTGELAVELADKLGTAAEYNNMNRIAAESYAKAVGMTRDELSEVLTKQELLSKIGAKDTDNAQRRLQLAVQKFQTEDNARKALGEDVYNNMVQLSVQEKIAALIEKVKTSIQEFILNSGVIDKIQQMMDYLTSPSKVKSLISIIKEGVAIVADMIQGMAIAMLHVAEVFATGEDDAQLKRIRANISEQSFGDNIRYSGNSTAVSDFRLKALPEDTITSSGVSIEGGTKLGRTDEMVDLLKQILSETKQGKVMSFNIDGAPVATAVAKNAPNVPSASNLGPRPLR